LNSFYRVPNWLPQDTEESIPDTEWHQEAAGAIADVLREAAFRNHLSWGVCEEIALHGLRYEDGGPYDPRPDVMVLAQPLPSGGLAAVSVAEVGAPLLIVEVASRSTAAHDIGEKRHAYAAIGVAEYLVFDPDGGLLPAPLMAWRLGGAGYVPWGSEPDGWWRSEALGVGFRPQLRHLEVRDQEGERIELSHEVRMRARHLEQERGELERQLADEARRRTELEEEIRRLRARVEPDIGRM
jgi:Uma2 family endonuclease